MTTDTIMQAIRERVEMPKAWIVWDGSLAITVLDNIDAAREAAHRHVNDGHMGAVAVSGPHHPTDVALLSSLESTTARLREVEGALQEIAADYLPAVPPGDHIPGASILEELHRRCEIARAALQGRSE